MSFQLFFTSFENFFLSEVQCKIQQIFFSYFSSKVPVVLSFFKCSQAESLSLELNLLYLAEPIVTTIWGFLFLESSNFISSPVFHVTSGWNFQTQQEHRLH